MKTQVAPLLAIAAILIPLDAMAYEFLCRSKNIVGFDGFCPVGDQDFDECGCNTPSTAVLWDDAYIGYRVENQGGNGVSASQFVAATQSAAEAWTDVSCSTMQVEVVETFSATSSTRFGSGNVQGWQEIFFVTSNSEWIGATGAGAGGTLGVTVSPWTQWDCTSRRFVDTDILINGFI